MEMKRAVALLLACLLVMAVATSLPGPVLGSTLELTAPVGGETLYIGLTSTVTWTGVSESAVMTARLSLDSGATYPIELGSGTGGSITFTVPNNPTTTARVKISGEVTKKWIGGIWVPIFGSAESAADFTIRSFVLIDPILPIVPIEPLVPTAPTELRTTRVDGAKIALAWTDNSSIETGFRVFRRLQQPGFTWGQIAELGVNATVYSDFGPFEAGKNYEYKVLAFNSAGVSLDSNTITVTIPQVDPAPEPDPVVTTTVIRLQVGSQTYQVNGMSGQMDTAPMIIGGRTLLPIRYVADPLGAALGWSSGESKATVQMGGTLLELWIGNNQARVNGVNRYIDPFNHEVYPIIVPPGRTMLPLRFIAEALGCDVVWNPVDKSVTVTYESSV